MPKDDFIGVLIWIVRFLLKTELVHNQFINHSSLSAQIFFLACKQSIKLQTIRQIELVFLFVSSSTVIIMALLWGQTNAKTYVLRIVTTQTNSLFICLFGIKIIDRKIYTNACINRFLALRVFSSNVLTSIFRRIGMYFW